ncbi:helix-turn-helix transcriptional regulator [Knoellia koreensis]|jgi:transcriptional regulator with XRE-family HTH domain|nr:helix-turn-helix transcriptional regulator [Knoellia sp. DB2414S]
MQTDPLVDPQALRDARVKAGLTQHELARLVGVAGGERVSRWERSASVPRAEVLHRIADVLNVTSADLLVPATGDPDLRRLRVLAGLSARQVAEETHVSVPTYARWESGQLDRMPSQVALQALAKVLGVGVDEVRAALTAARRGGE